MKEFNSNFGICIFAAAFFFVCILKVIAQDAEVPHKVYMQKIEFGARFMPTFSSFDMQTSSGSTVKGQVVPGYGAGGLLKYHFNSHIELQAEVNYSSIGRKYTELYVEQKINLRYINIPLLVSVNTGKFRPVNFNIVLGPQFGIMVGSSVGESGDGGSRSPQAMLSVKKSDLGFAYGAGLDFGLNKSSTIRMGSGFRGVYGLFNISDNGSIEDADFYYILDQAQMQTYSVYIGLLFLFR